MTDKTPHIIVIGAGIVGASVAYHLVAEQGAAVSIVAADVGGTATPCSFSWINANFSNEQVYYDWRRRSMLHWHELVDHGSSKAVPGLADIVRWCGNVQWASASPEQLEADGKQHSSWGYSVKRVESAEILAREPWLAAEQLPASGWALELADEGYVEAADAAKLLVKQAQAKAAERGGSVKLITGTVQKLLTAGDAKDGAVVGIVTAAGETIAADHVVMAAGLGAVPLCADIGIRVPLRGRPGMLVHSKPVAQRLLNGLVISSGPHMRQTIEGRLLSGGNFAGSDPGKDPQAEADALFARLKSMFRPSLADGTPLPPIELDYYTIGMRPDPEDGLPILGASGRPGLTLAVMHSGVTLAAIVGQTIAELAATGKADPDLAKFSLTRFSK